MLIWLMKKNINNPQSKSCAMNLKYILVQSKQFIYFNKYEHQTGTLTTILLNPVGEANTYVRSGYSPQKSLYPTQGQVSGSTNANLMNKNKHVNNQQH